MFANSKSNTPLISDGINLRLPRGLDREFPPSAPRSSSDMNTFTYEVDKNGGGHFIDIHSSRLTQRNMPSAFSITSCFIGIVSSLVSSARTELHLSLVDKISNIT